MDFSAEFLFDSVQIESIFIGDEIDSETKVTESARTTYTMKVRLCVLRKVEVDDYVDSLNIDTTGE